MGSQSQIEFSRQFHNRCHPSTKNKKRLNDWSMDDFDQLMLVNVMSLGSWGILPDRSSLKDFRDCGLAHPTSFSDLDKILVGMVLSVQTNLCPDRGVSFSVEIVSSKGVHLH